MMPAESDGQPERKSKIELEPLATRAAPDRYVTQHTQTPRPDRDLGQPVPAAPVHLCPQCDRDLKGLTSRQCPECGSPFTLEDARQHARNRSPRHQEDVRSLFGQRLCLCCGVALLLSGTFVPMFVFRDGSPAWKMLLPGAGVLILAVSSMYKVFFQKTWADAMMIAGLVSAGLGTLLLLIA